MYRQIPLLSSGKPLLWLAALVFGSTLSGCTLLMPGPTEDDIATTPQPPAGGIPPVVDTTQPLPPTTPAPLPPVTGGTGNLHTVQRGDTLYGIARQYGQNWQSIAQWNNLAPPYNISPGQQLVVSNPGTGGSTNPPVTTFPVEQPSQPIVIRRVWNEDGTYTEEVVSGPPDVVAGLPSAPAPVVTTPAPAASIPSIPMSGGTTHTVMRGDTLYGISRRYGQSVNQIAAWNGLAPPYNLSVGQVLTVSASGGVTPSTVAAAPPVMSPASSTHTVQPGDTLYSISRRYGQSVAELAASNNLAPPYNLSIGQVLMIDGRHHRQR